MGSGDMNPMPSQAPGGKLKKRMPENMGSYGKLMKLGSLTILLGAAILVGALASFFAFSGNGNESNFVMKGDYQAVFINVNGTNGGQVYFGHITNMTGSYIALSKVFYIQNQSNANTSNANSYTLVKLGCELHGPADQMLINRSQVYFWENLKPSGQVTQKINQYYQQNPNGQNCSNATGANSTTQGTGTTQTPATTTTPSTSPAATGTTKKQ
jgi:hypothetical protein